jgi:hypothetical protein
MEQNCNVTFSFFSSSATKDLRWYFNVSLDAADKKSHSILLNHLHVYVMKTTKILQARAFVIIEKEYGNRGIPRRYADITKLIQTGLIRQVGVAVTINWS